MMNPARIDFSQLGSAIGDKIKERREAANTLPWARPEWQGAPQGYAAWRGPGAPNSSIGVQPQPGFRRPMPGLGMPGGQYANFPGQGMPFQAMPDPWAWVSMKR